KCQKALKTGMEGTFTSKFNPFRDFLLNDRHIHPYLILLVDVLIVFISFSLSYLIVGGFGFDQMDFLQYLWAAGCFSLVAFPVIYFARLHTGLLRYSNTADLFHIFAATLSFSFLFLAFYYGLGYRWVGMEPKFLLLVLLINFFITSTLLIAFRLLAKAAYLILSRRMYNRTVHRVLIFGSDQNAVLVKQALSNDPE